MWFPTPIYYHQFAGKELDGIQREFDRAVPLYLDHLSNPWDDTVLTTFSYDGETDFLKDTPKLRDKIGQHVGKFIAQDVKVMFRESWMNVCRKYSYQNYHYHSDSIISGVYYYRTTGSDGAIKFKPDSVAYQDSKLISLLNIATTTAYQPAVGKLLLFPSFLQHAVLMNTSAEDRISISFNINVSRQ